MNLRVWRCEMRAYQQAHTVLRMPRCEDVRIQGYDDVRMQLYQSAYRSHKPKVWGYEDARMQAHTNMSIWGWEDARIKGNTHESEDMRMQGYQQTRMNLRVWDVRMRGYKQTHTNLGIWHKDVRMWGYEDTSTWVYEDVRMQGCKQTQMNLRISGCEDARMLASTNEP